MILFSYKTQNKKK